MNLDYNFISIIDFLGLTQGILLGIILLLGHKKERPSLFLGLFLFTYSIELTHSILEDMGILVQKPELIFLPTNFMFLSLPLLYLYTKNLIDKEFPTKKLWVLIPGLLEFLIYSYLFLLPVSQKISLYKTFYGGIGNDLYWISTLVYSIGFAALTIRLINRHQLKVSDYFSKLHNRQLKWVKAVAVFLLVFASTWLLGLVLPDSFANSYLYPFNSVINVFFIYWVGISGLRQPKVLIPENIETLISENQTAVKEDVEVSTKTLYSNESFVSETAIKEPLSESALIEEENIQEEVDEMEATYQALLQWMEDQKPFTNSDLNLSDLATSFRISPKKLSQIINQKAELNFNRFINQYRIDAAKKMLTDAAFDHLTVVSIGYDVGFNSKASFYAVFKQFTNTTPAKFKKQQLILKSPKSSK